MNNGKRRKTNGGAFLGIKGKLRGISYMIVYRYVCIPYEFDFAFALWS